jgi:hypothetical protein
VDEDGGGGDGWVALLRKAIQSFRLPLNSGLRPRGVPPIARKDAMNGAPDFGALLDVWATRRAPGLGTDGNNGIDASAAIDHWLSGSSCRVGMLG